MVQSKKQGKYMTVFNAVLHVFCICMCGSRNFHQVGGVAGPGPPDSKKLGQRFLLFLLFFSPHLNLFNSFTEGTDPRVRWFIFWKTIIFQGSRGHPTFDGVGEGTNFSPGVGEMLISVETYRNCDFPRTPYPLSVSAHVLPSLVARTQ